MKINKKNLNNLLKERLKQWEDETIDYDSPALDEVKKYNLEYRKCGKYPYNSDILNYILKLEKVEEDLIKHLKTEIFLSQHDISNDEKEDLKKEMIDNGYIPLTNEIAEKVCSENKKIQLTAMSTMDWLTHSYKDEIFKIKKTGDTYMLLKPRARSRGYYISRFENTFCKIID